MRPKVQLYGKNIQSNVTGIYFFNGAEGPHTVIKVNMKGLSTVDGVRVNLIGPTKEEVHRGDLKSYIERHIEAVNKSLNELGCGEKVDILDFLSQIVYQSGVLGGSDVASDCQLENKTDVSEAIFRVKSENIEGYESHGEIREVEGTIVKILEESFYLDGVYRTSDEIEKYIKDNPIQTKQLGTPKVVKFSDGFSVNNKDGVTIEKIAELLLNGGTTDSYKYTILSSVEVEKEDLIEYLNSLYIAWYDRIEDFPSYYLKGL